MTRTSRAPQSAAKQQAEWIPPPPMWRKEAVPWLVKFAKTDPNQLASGRPGDLANLLWDLRRFVNIQTPGPIEDEIRRAERDPTVLTGPIDIAKRLVTAVADRARAEFNYDGGKFVMNRAEGEPTRMVMRLEDAVLFSALYDYDIDEKADDRLKRCKECSEIFAADRKDAVYCGRQCANAAAVRAYRQRQREGTTRVTRSAKRRTS